LTQEVEVRKSDFGGRYRNKAKKDGSALLDAIREDKGVEDDGEWVDLTSENRQEQIMGIFERFISKRKKEAKQHRKEKQIFLL